MLSIRRRHTGRWLHAAAALLVLAALVSAAAHVHASAAPSPCESCALVRAAHASGIPVPAVVPAPVARCGLLPEAPAAFLLDPGAAEAAPRGPPAAR